MNLFTLIGEFLLRGTDEAKREINDVTNTAEQSEPKMVTAFKNIGLAVAGAFAIDKIKDFGVAIVEASATVSAEMSAFEQIMGGYSDTAQTKLNEVADSTGMVSTRLTPHMTSLTAKFKGLGNDIETSTDLATRGLTLAADASAFWDKSLDDSMSALNSFINGSYEGGEAIGLFANDTQLASYAVSKGIVEQAKDWANLDEKTKQATRLEYAENMMALSGATGQASKESGAYANVQANLAEKWRQFKAEIGEPLLENVVIPAMTKLSGVVDSLSVKWEELQTWVSENKNTIDLMIGIVASLTAGFIAYQSVLTTMSIIQMVTKWLDGMTLSQKLLNVAMNANPIGLVITAISALVTAFILLWNNCEEFRNFWIGLWENIKSAFQTFVDWISPAIETIKGFFIGLWTQLQEMWTQITNSLQPLVTAISGAFSEAWDLIKVVWDLVQPYFETIWNAIQTVFSVVSQVLGGFFESAWIVIQGVWNVASLFFQTIWDNIKAVFSVVETYFRGAFNTAWEAVKAVWNVAVAFFTSIWDSIKAVFSVVKSVLTGNFKDAWEGIKDVLEAWIPFFRTLWSNIKTVFGSVKSWFSSTFTSAWTAIKNVFSNWGEFFSGLWDTIKNTFVGLGTTLGNAIGGAVKTAINGVLSFVEDTINNAIGLINSAINLINKIPGIDIGTIGTISLPKLAKGGVVDSPTIAEIGEEGREAIVPLERNTEWIGGLARAISPAIIENSSDSKEVATLREELKDIRIMLSEYLSQLINKNTDIVLNGESLAYALAPSVDTNLGDINRLRARGI